MAKKTLLWFKFAILITILFLTASSVVAEFVISVGGLEVQILTSRVYTVGDVIRNGQKFCSKNVSQGSAFKIDGIWCGGVHTHETVLEVEFKQDGISVPIQDGSVYLGDRFELHRRTAVGSAYILNSVLTVTSNRIEEIVDLQGYNEAKNCEVLYGIMSSRDNRLQDYAAFSDNGDLIMSGVINKDDNIYVYLDPAVAVVQYDSVNQNGVLAWMIGGTQYNMKYFVWDLLTDNKLYSRFYGAEGICSLQNHYQFRQITYFFDAASDLWQDTAQSFIRSYCKVAVQGDLTNDCKVNLDDLLIIASNWLQEEGDN